MNDYRTLAEIKGLAREHLSGSYGVTVKAYIWMNMILLCMTWLSVSIFQPDGSRVFYIIFYILHFIVSGLFSAGCAFLYLNIVNGQPAFGSMIFHCFRNQTDKTVLICFFRMCLEYLCAMVMMLGYAAWVNDRKDTYLVIMAVGTIIYLAGYLIANAIFMPSYYLIHDFPEYKASEIVRLCPRITRGHVGRLIWLNISLIPLKLLEILSLGVGAPWVESYISAIYAEYYMDLMNPSRNHVNN